MKTLTYTLLADGSSDRCLLPVITWVLLKSPIANHGMLIDPQFADHRDLPNPPQGLTERIRKTVEEFPCDFLFVHRDAEREAPARRREEIIQAAQEAGISTVICIVPVRMTEAWLLFDESAIRTAAGNPKGDAALKLPSLKRTESEPDPKTILRQALEAASESSGRKLKQFQRDIPSLVPRVAELIEDFSPLRALSAFRAFETDVHRALTGYQPLQPLVD